MSSRWGIKTIWKQSGGSLPRRTCEIPLVENLNYLAAQTRSYCSTPRPFSAVVTDRFHRLRRGGECEAPDWGFFVLLPLLLHHHIFHCTRPHSKITGCSNSSMWQDMGEMMEEHFARPPQACFSFLQNRLLENRWKKCRQGVSLRGAWAWI